MLKLKLFPLVFLVCYPEVKIKFCNETIKVGQTSLFAPQPCAPVSGQYMFVGQRGESDKTLIKAPLMHILKHLNYFFLDKRLHSALDALIFDPLWWFWSNWEFFFKTFKTFLNNYHFEMIACHLRLCDI